MSVGEILSLTHGFLGILLIAGTPWALAELFVLKDHAGIRRLKMVTLGLVIASFLSCIILAAPTYITYYPAAEAEIKAGPNPWAHGILMEVKEHIGLIEPMIMLLVAVLVWGSSDDLIRDKKTRGHVKTLLVIGFILAFAVMAMGAFIAKTGPIR